MAEQLFQIGIKAVIRNQKGEVLLQAFEHDGVVKFWDLPGGRMDPGETFLETLVRELQEEIDVVYDIARDGEPVPLLTMLAKVKIRVGDEQIPLVMLAYEVELPASAEPRAAEEDAVIAWVSPAVAAKQLANKFPPEFCQLIAALAR